MIIIDKKREIAKDYFGIKSNIKNRLGIPLTIALFRSQTAKDTYWVFASNVFASFFAFLYTIFLARSFSPSSFGLFSAVLSFSLLVSDIGDLGIGSGLSRYIPEVISRGKKEKLKDFIKTSFYFQGVVSVILFFLIFAFSPLLAEVILTDKSRSFLFTISAFGVLGVIMLAQVTYILSSQKKFKQVAIINTTSSLLKVVLIVFLFYSARLNVEMGLIAFMASFFITLVAVVPRFLSFDFVKAAFNINFLRRLMSYSSFLAISKIFSALSSRLDILMLVPLSSPYEAGIYSASFKIISVYILLSSSLSMVIAPRLSSFSKVSQSITYLKKVTLVVFGILATQAVLYFIAPYFVVFVLGSQYVASVSVFQALLFPIALFTLTIPTVNFLLYTLSKPQVSTFNTFVSLIIIFFGNMYFIPRLGRYGPVITLSLSYGFTLLSTIFFSVYFYGKRKDYSPHGS